MPAHSLFAPRPRRSPAALAALDFGLAVRIDAHPSQRTLFYGAEHFSLQELTSELSQMVSELRVRSFSLRAQIEHVTTALLRNVDCGFRLQARHAAIDLGDLLSEVRARRMADAELCVRGSRCAFRIAELCAKEVR
jgi:hypothetical protein